MKKFFIIGTLFTLSSLLSKAQDTQPHKAQPDSIIKVIPIDEGRSEGYLYTIGGKLQTAEDVKIRLLRYAPSAYEYHRAKTSLVWTIVSTGGFFVTSTAAVIDYAHNNKHAGETTGIVDGSPAFIYQHHSLTGAYVLTGLATGFLVSTFINLAHVAKHGNKAIKVYNQQYE